MKGKLKKEKQPKKTKHIEILNLEDVRGGDLVDCTLYPLCNGCGQCPPPVCPGPDRPGKAYPEVAD